MPAIPRLHGHRSAGAHAGRWPRRAGSLPRRAWRRRSRRAQVSAVATILGLLLVVTFIANYLATTLPNTMGQNDLQHEVIVENQVAQLSALSQVTAQSGALGSEISQPITLGSASAPPFANADSSTVLPGNATGGLGVSFTLTGGSTYNPPTGGPSGVSAPGCTTTSSTILCSGGATVNANFTGALGGQATYAVTLSGGGSLHLNIASNHSVISVTVSASTSVVFDLLGNNDTVTMDVSTLPETILILGNDDTLTMTGSGTNSHPNILVVGNRDTVTTSALSGTNSVVATYYGSSEVFTPGVLSGTANFGVYFNGFNPSSPSPTCPVDNLSSSDIVHQPTGGTSFAVTYNNTVYSGSGTNGKWGVTYQIPTPFSCPFFSQAVQPISNGLSPPSASFIVQLRNTYAPSAEVAYDQGAVVYAQPGSIPIFYAPPPISFANGVLTLFVPQFYGHLGSEAGVGTADITLRLLSSHSFVVPSNSFGFQASSNVVITIKTPYAAAWAANLLGNSALAPYVTCAPISCVTIAKTLYYPGHALDTITLSIPTAGLIFDLLTAQYAVNID
ncbi:MAG: hypothetical protein WB786_01000 [Thermoplasmata archaeon]